MPQRAPAATWQVACKAVMQVGLQTALSTQHDDKGRLIKVWGASAHLLILSYQKESPVFIHRLNTVSVRVCDSHWEQSSTEETEGIVRTRRRVIFPVFEVS